MLVTWRFFLVQLGDYIDLTSVPFSPTFGLCCVLGWFLVEAIDAKKTSGGPKLRQNWQNKTPCELVHLPDVSLRKILGLENLQANPSNFWWLRGVAFGLMLAALFSWRLQALLLFWAPKKGR